MSKSIKVDFKIKHGKKGTKVLLKQMDTSTEDLMLLYRALESVIQVKMIEEEFIKG